MANDRIIEFDFGEVVFRVNKRSKHVRIKIHPQQGVVVSMPENCPINRAINFVIEKELWIRKSLDKVSKTKSQETVFDENTSFKTFAHQLVLCRHDKASLRMEARKGELKIFYPATASVQHNKIQDFVRMSILKVLRYEAQKHLPKRTKELAQANGLEVNVVRVRNNKTRWGSCSAQNNINLNIHLMRLPQELIDYVIYHELAHVKVKNHSAKYWAYLEKLLPGAKMLDKKLNKYHLVYW